MQFLVFALIVPAIYITYLTFVWFGRKDKSKKNRVHQTKKAIWLLLLSIVLLYICHKIAYSALRYRVGESFWLYSMIYFLSAALIAGYYYIVVKATNSRKNLTKVLVAMLSLSLYLPFGWWVTEVVRGGVYDGRFGTSKNMAIKLTDEYVGPRINHSFKKVVKQDGYWLVTETLRTLDSKNSIDVDYRVSPRDGQVHNDHSEISVPLGLSRSNGSGDGLEMMLFQDLSDDPRKPELKSLQYAISDEQGKAELSVRPGTDLKYYLQVRDCSFSCQSFVYKFMPPIKESYNITINQFQPTAEI